MSTHDDRTGQVTDTDYLVVGAGASGMAFVDTLLDESDADITLVDRRHRLGGDWVDAYGFVRLHQSARSYGVASRELWGPHLAAEGPFDGLATGSEIPSSRRGWTRAA